MVESHFPKREGGGTECCIQSGCFPASGCCVSQEIRINSKEPEAVLHLGSYLRQLYHTLMGLLCALDMLGVVGKLRQSTSLQELQPLSLTER